MKTIFRYTNLTLLVAAIFAAGTVTIFAQDPCVDADGQIALYEKFNANFLVKTIEGRKSWIEVGKQFLDKYGACESAKTQADYFKDAIPKWEMTVKKLEADKIRKDLLMRFDSGLNTKNWDDVYASGKEILQKYPDEFRAVELVLGSIGYDELLDRKISKYNDETLKFAKLSLADLEAGKEFKPSYGIGGFKYDNKDHAIAWMNLTIGTIYQLGFKNKGTALPYLYKATQGAAGTDVAKNPNPYEFIGLYYFDELNKLVDEIKALADSQKDTDTPEVAKQKVDQIKAKVGMSNGTAERAVDAFSRAYERGGQSVAYKKKMKENVEGAYKVRFGKTEGLDAWVAKLTSKPFPNPTTQIAPISDPEPTASTTTTTVPPVVTAPVTTKPATTMVKPAGTKSAPATTKPATVTKPQAVVKKPAGKKKVG